MSKVLTAIQGLCASCDAGVQDLNLENHADYEYSEPSLE
jgi:hypothetical protein